MANDTNSSSSASASAGDAAPRPAVATDPQPARALRLRRHRRGRGMPAAGPAPRALGGESEERGGRGRADRRRQPRLHRHCVRDADHAGRRPGGDALSARRRRVRALHHQPGGAARRAGQRDHQVPAPDVLRRLRHPRRGEAGAGRVRADVHRPRAAPDRDRSHPDRRGADPGLAAGCLRFCQPGSLGRHHACRGGARAHP